MRAIAALFSGLAVLAGSYAGYSLQRAFGPTTSAANASGGDNGSFFGGGSPGGSDAERRKIGSFFKAANTKRILATVRKEIGAKGKLENLTIRADGATVLARSGGKRVTVLIDASGEARRNVVPYTGALSDPVAIGGIAPDAIEKMAKAASQRSRKHRFGTVDYAVAQSLGIPGAEQAWLVYFKDGGYYFADLDGSNLRRPGE